MKIFYYTLAVVFLWFGSHISVQEASKLTRQSMGKPETIQARARELARSGNFYGWPPLEFELRFEDGYSEAREWLQRPATRDELDRMCQAARKRRHAA
jgi:hypothetical protein